jgi:hypothetical protein
LQKAGNPDYSVITIEGVGHVLTPATTGCLDEAVSSEWATEYLDTLEIWIQDHSP